jgi:SLT domain-containing protein
MLLGRVLFQMQTESGGNPNAINLGDINARMGDPSRGLMQTIGSTFAAYHWPGTSWNIFNPFANIAAALNYARHVYGPSLMSGGMGIGSGHGYDHGGFLPTGWSMAYNGTGKPEPVGMAQHIVLEVVGNSSDPLVKWLKEQVRVRGGGNVQAAFGARGR